MSRVRFLGPALAVVVAVVGAVALTRDRADPPPAGPTTTVTIPPVAVTSDARRLATLDELVGASDLIVRGEVTGTDRGRLFGEPGAGAIESRLVTVRITSVLAGDAPSGDELVIEEEGWLEDGTPIAVDGAAPSAVGDDAIWFLVEVETADGPVHVVVSAQGRYLVVDDELRGADLDDPLVLELVAMSPAELAAAVAAPPNR